MTTGSLNYRTTNKQSRLTSAWLPSAIALSCLLFASGHTQATERVTYYYTDQQGTPLATTDANGSPAAVDYRPYGTQAIGDIQISPAYAGQSYDPDVGIVYMSARYYDPLIGRFISTDPIMADPGDLFQLNRFAYANNNPISNFDPTGMMSQDMDGVADNCQATPECRSSGPMLRQRLEDDRPLAETGESKSSKSPAPQQGSSAKPLDPTQVDPVDLPGMTVFYYVATTAGSQIPKGTPFRGIVIHTLFSAIIRALPAPYHAEESYLNGRYLPFGYGKLGTSRADGIYGDRYHPQFAVELKTGSARFGQKQIDKYTRNLPKGTRVYGIFVPP